METFVQGRIGSLWGRAPESRGARSSKRPMTFDDLMAIKRVGDAQISPDGSRVAYVVTDVDKNLNRGKRSVWAVPARAARRSN